MPALNLLGKCRPTGKQISGTQYSHSHPWHKLAQFIPVIPLNRLTSTPQKRKKTLNNKQETEKDMKQRG
jgi:hypothetical protein